MKTASKGGIITQKFHEDMPASYSSSRKKKNKRTKIPRETPTIIYQFLGASEQRKKSCKRYECNRHSFPATGGLTGVTSALSGMTSP